MSEITVNINHFYSYMAGLRECVQAVYNLRTQINVVSTNLSHGDSSMGSVKESLVIVSGKIEKTEQKLRKFAELLREIEKIYKDTENNIIEENPSSDNKFRKEYKNTYKENLETNLRNEFIEETVSLETLYMGSMGLKIAKGVGIALPILTGVLDYKSLREKGQNKTDSAIKASAHAGIGLVSGCIGTAAGAAVAGAAAGSVVPVAGTVAGLVVGFCVGVAIETTGSMAFDYAYDHHLKKHVDKAKKKIKNSSLKGNSVEVLAGG